MKNTFPGAEVGPRWVQIDLDAIRHNVAVVKNLLNPETRLMAVVKADAYGLGALEVAWTVVEAGADMLGVTTVDEGLELRRNGIEAPILVFAPLLPREFELAANNHLTATVESLDFLKKISAQDYIRNKIHIKLNTGMNRFGIDPHQLVQCFDLAQSIPGLEIEGIYTHLATTPLTNKSFMEKQFRIFCDAIKNLEDHGIKVPIKHICNSAAVVEMPQMHLDMVRVGNLLYSQLPPARKGKLDLKDPWTAHARVLTVRRVAPGEAVGYGCDFKAKKETAVGIIPIGFADGLDITPQFKPKSIGDLVRMLVKTVLSFFGKRAGTPLASINGKPLKMVGRIGMQVAAVDLSEFDQVKAGDTVQVFLRRTTASSRLPRVYLLDGRLQSIRTAAGYRACSREQLELQSSADPRV